MDGRGGKGILAADAAVTWIKQEWNLWLEHFRTRLPS
jgi:hypothetical protein